MFKLTMYSFERDSHLLDYLLVHTDADLTQVLLKQMLSIW